MANFTATSVSGCSPLVVSFSDASSGNPTSWFWDFGNGATSTLKNPSTTYFITGSYNVTLTVSNNSGSHTTVKQQFVTVYGKPVVLFAGNDSLGCYPFPVRFTDLSSPSPGTTNNSWIWDFGDGGQATNQNPLNTYLNSGNYTVSLKVTNDKGCFSTFTKPAYIRINGGVKADFNFSLPTVCRTPVTVNFSNLSTGPGILSYQWQFGDGGSSTLQSPVHTYTSAGTYSVSLITRSSSGCVDTFRMNNVFDFKDIITSFTAPDSVCVNEPVNILNTSSSTAANTSWSFGNGNGANSINGTTSYSVPGTYTIRLFQSYGSCSDSASKIIKVRPRPLAGFNVDKSGFCQVPATINFSNTSSGGVSYQWIFGDGISSTQQNTSHTYTTFGNFEAILIVTNSTGCTDSFKRTISIGKPVISFNSLPQEGCIPYAVNFSAGISSPEPVVSYLWDFGNGVTSTAASPSYIYTTQGSYAVSLTVTTAGGCTQTYSMPAAVKVGTKPVVNFSVTPREVCAFRQVLFTNQTTGGGTEFLWSFGDGGTSTLQNPAHEYGDTGVFNVTLYVKNNGCRDSLKIDSIVKIKPPIAKFEVHNTCADKLNITFLNQSIGALTSHWDFGDGNTSTLENPVHRYTAYGIYTVTLTVTNDTCTHQMKRVIRIEAGGPDFKANLTSACKGATISFTADTTNMADFVSYEWSFGNGAIGSGMSASTIYPRPGIYTVTLTVTDRAGCRITTTKPQYIRINGPTAGFIASNNNGCRNLTASFTDSSQADGVSNIVNWQWNFGDGTTVSNNSPATVQHLYSQSGAYAVSLKLTDAGGCVDSITKPALVNVSNIKADFVSADTVSCPNAAIRFTNQSSSSSVFSSYWQFGDGDTSTQNNPVAFYNADGVYSVKLKIADALGCVDSLTRLNYISIKSPVAKYTVSDSVSACTPFQVRFTNTSTYYTGFSWDLAGGTSSLPNPIQYYNQPGVYQTQLIVTSPGGCKDTATQTITVNDVRNARINYLPLNGCKPLTVNVNSIAPKNMNYVWDFGDGTILSSNDTATTHVYNFFGDFVPKLILTDASGCVIPVTGPDTIRIKGATAKFAVDKRLLCDSGLVRFLDSTTFNNPIISYEWNFGDGTTSNQPSVSHYYSQPGIYPVSVNVLTQNQCVDTFRLNVPVKVVQSPDIRIEGDSVICIGEGMMHIGEFNRTDTSIVRWAWSFPNGNTANVQLPQRQVYKVAGNFAVRTTATNSSGCFDTVTKSILVNPLPWVEMPSVLTTRTGTPIQIPAEYFGGVVSYDWNNISSLSCSTCPEPVASPKFNTEYDVSFIDKNGCRNNGRIKIIVFCNNDNVFVPNTFSPNGDGSNDIFYVRGKGLNRVKSLRIFNRWGQVVYEKFDFGINDASAGWDGKFKGAKPIPDVYVYQMEVWCDNSTIVRFDGNVALIQ